MGASISHSVAMRERRSANQTEERERGYRAEDRRGEAAWSGCLIEGMRDGRMHRGVCYLGSWESLVIGEWLCTALTDAWTHKEDKRGEVHLAGRHQQGALLGDVVIGWAVLRQWEEAFKALLIGVLLHVFLEVGQADP